MSHAAGYHQTRFSPDPKRDIVWRTLCDCYFNKLISDDFHVVDLGAGHGSFINHVRAARRTAIDIWPGLKDVADQGVNVHIGDVTDLSFLEPGSVDFAFASNLFEHLSQEQLIGILNHLQSKLSTR